MTKNNIFATTGDGKLIKQFPAWLIFLGHLLEKFICGACSKTCTSTANETEAKYSVHTTLSHKFITSEFLQRHYSAVSLTSIVKG
jgi:hypothetical protein